MRPSILSRLMRTWAGAAAPTRIRRGIASIERPGRGRAGRTRWRPRPGARRARGSRPRGGAGRAARRSRPRWPPRRRRARAGSAVGALQPRRAGAEGRAGCRGRHRRRARRAFAAVPNAVAEPAGASWRRLVAAPGGGAAVPPPVGRSRAQRPSLGGSVRRQAERPVPGLACEGRQAHQRQRLRLGLRRLGRGLRLRLGWRRRCAAGCGRGPRPGSHRPTGPCPGGSGVGLGSGGPHGAERRRRCGGRLLGRSSAAAPAPAGVPTNCLERACALAFCSVADRLLEGHAVRLEQPCRRALAVAHDGRQHDGPVDLPPARLLRGLARRLPAPAAARRSGRGSVPGVARMSSGSRAQIARHVRAEAIEVDVAGPQHARGIRVLREGQQQVLQQSARDATARARILRPPEALAQIGRHRNRLELVRNRLRHRRLPLTSASAGIARSRQPWLPMPALHSAPAGPPRMPLPHKSVREQGSIGAGECL